MRPSVDYRRIVAEAFRPMREMTDTRRLLAEAMRPWPDYRNVFAEALRPMREMTDARRLLAEAIRPSVDYRRMVAEALRPMRELTDLGRHVREAFAAARSRPKGLAETLAKSTELLPRVSEATRTFSETLIRAVERAPTSPTLESHLTATLSSSANGELVDATSALLEQLVQSTDNAVANLRAVVVEIKKQPTIRQIILIGILINIMSAGLLNLFGMLFTPTSTKPLPVSNQNSDNPGATPQPHRLRSVKRTSEVRGGPSRRAPRIGMVGTGHVVYRNQHRRRWSSIVYFTPFFEPRIGWIRSKYLKESDGASLG
jgi:hypothetical protein